jgi:hypothetical protein
MNAAEALARQRNPKNRREKELTNYLDIVYLKAILRIEPKEL